MWDEKFEEILRPYLPFMSEGEKLEADASMRDLGLDSLATVELMSVIEEAYNVRFVEEALTMETFATPATLWNALRTMTGASV